MENEATENKPLTRSDRVWGDVDEAMYRIGSGERYSQVGWRSTLRPYSLSGKISDGPGYERSACVPPLPAEGGAMGEGDRG